MWPCWTATPARAPPPSATWGSRSRWWGGRWHGGPDGRGGAPKRGIGHSTGTPISCKVQGHVKHFCCCGGGGGKPTAHVWFETPLPATPMAPRLPYVTPGSPGAEATIGGGAPPPCKLFLHARGPTQGAYADGEGRRGTHPIGGEARQAG